jgi:hypothetical protein
LEEILKKYGKWEEVNQLDTTALGEIMKEKQWESKVLEALKKYAELEKKKRLYLSRMKEQ